MGDRGNIVIRQESESNRSDVWFYTHWYGYGVNKVVQKALAKKRRWDDESYLARIVFDELTLGKQGQETGFGISTRMQDNEHPIIILDVPAQNVLEIEETSIQNGRLPHDISKAKSLGSFDEYIGLIIKD